MDSTRQKKYIKEFMSKKVVAVNPQTTFVELMEVFRNFNFHTIPVVDQNKILVGVVNFEDIMKVFHPQTSLIRLLKTIPSAKKEEEIFSEHLLETEISPEDAQRTLVKDLMNTNYVTVDEEADIRDAYMLMKLHKLGRLPVTHNKILVGFITLFDIIVGVLRVRGVISE